MRTLLFPFLVLAIVLIPVRTVQAKDCDCKQHKAGASGNGTCSLSEDASRCSITYSASASKAISEVESIAQKYNIRVPVKETFSRLNKLRPGDFRREDFRDTIINVFALTGAGEATTSAFVRDLRIDQATSGLWSLEFDNLYRKFMQDGCIEYQKSGLRLLLISTFSKFNGSCGP